MGSIDDYKQVVESVRVIADAYDLEYYDTSLETAASYAYFQENDPTFYYAKPVVNVAFRGTPIDITVGNLLPRDRVLVIGFSRSGDGLPHQGIEQQIKDELSKKWTVVEVGEGEGATGDQCA